MRFITLGNDSPKILKYNLRQLARLYPQAEVILYDWGHRPTDLADFRAANSNLDVRAWEVSPENLMLQKVACIHDCFARQPDRPLVYVDADVVVVNHIDVFSRSGWDIAATWRPDTGYMREVWGVGTWLNDGVVFVNCEVPAASLRFLQEWVDRCAACQDQSWWIDQVELIRLFSEADRDLSVGPELEGLLDLQDCTIRLRTLDGEIYNCLPEAYQPATVKVSHGSPKVIHLKSAWRKAKFGMAPDRLKTAWLGWIRSGYSRRPVLKQVNLGFNAVLRYMLAKRRQWQHYRERAKAS